MALTLTVGDPDPLYNIHPYIDMVKEDLQDLSYFDRSKCHDWSAVFKKLYPYNPYKLTDKGYNVKISLAVWSPDSLTAIDKISSSIFSKVPQRTVPNSTEFVKWMLDVDLNGTAWDTWVERSTDVALTYGSSFTLFQLPSTLSMNAVSLAEQLPNLRPVLKLFTPCELQDYKIANGQLVEILFRTKEWKDGSEYHKWYRIDTVKQTEYMQRVEDTTGTYTQTAQGNHNLGVVPVAIQYGVSNSGKMFGVSYIQNVIPLEFKKFKLETDLAFNGFLHMHLQKLVKSNEEKGSLGLEDEYTKVKPEESIDYIKVPTEQIQTARDLIKDVRMDIARKLQMDPMGFIEQDSKVEVSGKSRQLSFMASEERLLTSLANRIEEYETNALKLAATIMSQSDQITVSYPDNFSLTSDDILIDVYKDIKNDLPSRTMHKIVLTRIANSMVGDKPEANKAIADEIGAFIDGLTEEEFKYRFGGFSDDEKQQILSEKQIDEEINRIGVEDNMDEEDASN